jgi:magnesium chelatase subunit D
MAALARMRSAKSAALALLEKAYRHRCSIALIAFRHEAAEILLPPSRSAFLAFRQLAELPTGGLTPLADGLRAAHDVIRRALEKDPSLEPFLVLITDGKATYPANGFGAASRQAIVIAERRWRALCIDTETGLIRFAHTVALARILNADYIHTEDLPAAGWAPIIEEWLSWK